MQVPKSIASIMLAIGMFFTNGVSAQVLVEKTFDRSMLTSQAGYLVNDPQVITSLELLPGGVWRYATRADVFEFPGEQFPSQISGVFVQTATTFTTADVLAASNNAFVVGERTFDSGVVYGISIPFTPVVGVWFTTRFAPGLASFQIIGNNADLSQNTSFGDALPDGPLDGSRDDFGFGPTASPVPELPILALMLAGLALIGSTSTIPRRT